jgi:sugar lactone lactonase YvrE
MVAHLISSVKRFGMLVVLAALSACSPPPSLTPEAAKALTWLEGQVQSDGSLSNENASIATAYQVRTEALGTLALVDRTPSGLADSVQADTDDSTEWVARRALSLAAARRDAMPLINGLLTRQNPDGGYCGASGYESNALDTAWVLLALKATGTNAAQGISGGLGYLSSSINSDGSFGDGSMPATLYQTAFALTALQQFSQSYSLSGPVNKAKAWLVAQQGAGGSYGDVMSDAVAAFALQMTSTDASLYGGAINALKASQLANGSWSDDPYLTAVAMRTLQSAGQPPQLPTTGSVTGRVRDTSTLNALVGSTAQIVQLPNVSITADGEGKFTLSNVAPGSYTLAVTKAGYNPAQIAITINAGANTVVGDINLSPGASSAILRGSISDGANGGSLAGATIEVTGTAITTVTSGPDGSYQLSSLSPGVVTINVFRAGYATLNTSATLIAGGVLAFSPTLYADGTSPPTEASLQGQVLDASTGNPIAGAQIASAGLTTITDAAGQFSLGSLSIGAFTAEISASGYVGGTTLSGTLAAGANNAGILRLTPQVTLTSSSVSGTVTDSVTNTPIAGALVAVQGSSFQVMTGGDGRFSLSGIADAAFTVRFSAAGYLSSTASVSGSAHAQYVSNIALTKNTEPTTGPAAGVVLRSVEVSRPAIDPQNKIEFEAELYNTTASEKLVFVSATIYDAQAQLVEELRLSKLIGTPIANDSVKALAPNLVSEVELEWHNQSHAAGTYAVNVRVFDTDGRLIAEGSSAFIINPKALIGGDVSVDPPITQAGSNQPITMKASVLNFGNLRIPAGQVQLNVILDNPDLSVPSQGPATMETVFAGAPMDQPVGGGYDSAGNFYVANRTTRQIVRIAPNGTATVVTTLPALVSGNSVSPRDLRVDSSDNIWVLNHAQALIKITPAGIQSTFNTGIFSQRHFDLDASGNLYIVGSSITAAAGNALVRVTPAGTVTTLVGNGLANPIGVVVDGDGNFVVANYTDNTLSKISSTGRITPFVNGLNRPQGLAVDGPGNVYVANSGANTIVRVTPAGGTSVFASGLNNPYALKFDSNGNLLVANSGNSTIARVSPAGAVSTFAQSIASSPQVIKYDAAGNLYIINSDAKLSKLNTAGQLSTLAFGVGGSNGLAISTSGDAYVTTTGGAINKVSNGVVSSFTTGLQSPFGATFDSAGALFVAESGRNRIAIVNGTGQASTYAESAVTAPREMLTASNGDIYVLNGTNIAKLNGSSAAQVVARGLTAAVSFATAPTGGFYVIDNLAIKKVDGAGTITTRSTIAGSLGGIWAAADDTLYVTDSSTSRINKISPSGVVSTFASLPSVARAMIKRDAGGFFVLLLDGRIMVVSDSGLVTPFVTVSGAHRIAADGTGRLFVSGNNQIRVIDSLGATTIFKNGLNIPTGIAVGTNGDVLVAETDRNLVTGFSAAGSLLYTVAGFSGLRDLVWDGSRFVFTDSRAIFSLVPGQNPQVLAESSATQLTVANGTVLYTQGSGVFSVGAGGTTSSYYADSTLTNLRGIATAPNGEVTIASGTTGLVFSIDGTRQVTAYYPGLSGLRGLAIDGNNKVYAAASTNNEIVVLDADGKKGRVFGTNITAVSDLALSASGELYASAGASIYRFQSNGSRSLFADGGGGLRGIAIRGANVYVADYNDATLRVITNGKVVPFAAGLGNPEGIDVAADGSIYIVDNSSGTLSRFQTSLSLVASGLPLPRSVAVANDGRAFVAGLGTFNIVNPDGSKTNPGIGPLLNGWGIDSMTLDAAGKPTLTTTGQRTITKFTPAVSQATVTPGTIVHTATATVPAMGIENQSIPVNFGQWTPALAGDYRFVVTAAQAGVEGSMVNNLHVGPNARGEMSVDRARVAPGSANVAVRVDIQGADFTSLSKPDVANLTPSVSTRTYPAAIGADSAGNTYFLSGTTGLQKASTTGAITTIPAPTSFMRGSIPIDAQQNIYIGVTVSPYRVYRISPTGAQTVIATLDEPIFSMTINSRNELFALNQTKITKVQMDGTTSVVTSSGINSPYSITIDGQDNLYVQNQVDVLNPDGSFGHAISKVTPDGKTSVLLTEARMEFEGIGIAGDCADNLFVVPFEWQRVGQSLAEEYTIAQVIGRTGQVARILDGRPINPDFRDIDLIVFDRYSSTMLIWSDITGRIYKLPVTCGAIGADLHVVLPIGQTASGYTSAPTSSLTRPDGSTELVWNLKDVTQSGQAVRFDTTLNGLNLGDQRLAVKEAFLTFKNTFVTGEVKSPINIPSIQVDDAVAMSLSTDRTTYPANTDVLLGLFMANADTQGFSGNVKLDVLDANGNLVASLLNTTASIPARDELALNSVFNTGTTLPGNYVANAQLLASDGKVLAKASASFSIAASTSGGSGGNAALLAGSITTNKQNYGSFETVTITGRLRNNAANTTLSGLTVTETVKNADGVTVYAGTANVAQLLAGGLKDVTFSFKLANAAPGQYSVVQQVTDASGLSDITTAGFTVLSTAETGSGLTGTVGATPTNVEPGTAVNLTTTTNNLGNVDITGLPLNLFVVDPARDAIAAHWGVNANIAKGGSYSLNQAWSTNNVAPGTYVAVLIATIGTEQLTLGSAIVNVTAPVFQVKLNVTQSIMQSARVLVLTTCRPSAAEDLACTAARATFIDSYLTNLGIEHAVTTDEAGFRKALRSGRYNVYWLSGGAEKLTGSLAEEVREAVFRGDSLIMDGVHDARNKDLDAVVGVLHRGKLPTADQLITVAGPVFGPGVINTVGKPEKVQLAGGVQHAGFGTLTGYPALVTNDYGLGKGWLATFDLVGTLQANPTAANWKALLNSGIESVKPQSLATYPHLGYVPVEIKIQNQALATDLEVSVELPAGATMISTLPPATQLGANQPVWRFNLAEGATQTLKLSVRLAETSGALSIKTHVKSVRNGTVTPYNVYTTTLTAFAPQQVATQLVSELQVLAVTTNQDRVARDKAVTLINTALSQATTAQFDTALASLVNALFELRKINTADYSAQRVLLDQYLQYVQMKWYQAQPTQ